MTVGATVCEKFADQPKAVFYAKKKCNGNYANFMLDFVEVRLLSNLCCIKCDKTRVSSDRERRLREIERLKRSKGPTTSLLWSKKHFFSGNLANCRNKQEAAVSKLVARVSYLLFQEKFPLFFVCFYLEV